MKKCFGFSKMEKESFEMMGRVNLNVNIHSQAGAWEREKQLKNIEAEEN